MCCDCGIPGNIGDSAQLAQVGAIPIIKDMDSLGWFERVFNGNLFANPWGTALICVLMFILGLSLGSLALKPVSEYYRYKLEMVQLALNEVNDPKTNKICAERRCCSCQE